jgi:aspartate carbamoyltransferase catalytic subunit
MPHILTAEQFSQEELLALFEEAKKLQEAKKLPQTMNGKILATVFFEPSTRTRLSFETAMIRLGGGVISIPNKESSSMNKGETVEDTARMISTYADIIAIRAQEKGQVAQFASTSSVPVMNAGDGTGEHPTQHLLDFYTVWKERGTLDGLTLGLMGDCANSRVLRGMAKMAARFDMNLIFIAPEELKMGDDVKAYLEQEGKSYSEVESIGEVIGQLDILDINRIRHEYFDDKERALEIGKQFILGSEMVKQGKDDLIVLDPLPRINTVQTDVDELPQAKYFEAVENGLYIRMALINKLLG